MDLDPVTVKQGFDAARSAIETMKTLWKAIATKSNGESESVSGQIELAEKELRLAEAQIASALGYPLCRAHFPPVPMLKSRVDPDSAVAIYKCPECNLEDPSPEEFEKNRRCWAQNTNIKVPGGWMSL